MLNGSAAQRRGGKGNHAIGEIEIADSLVIMVSSFLEQQTAGGVGGQCEAD